ncbi:MAG: M56 family metallopeptidase, partial [Hyphomicrobium sp.]|nr:M56 family metallopeptidase [Hyphomicrobium sp.]
MTAWAFDTLVATTALMLLVLALREPVRRQFGATAAYALWLLPAARMVMPPITQTVERIVPAAAPAEAPLMAAPIAPTAPLADPSLLDQLGAWPALIIGVWASGTNVFLALGLIRYRRQRRVALDGAVQLARLGSIRLVRSHSVRGPIAFGIIDRVIAVPHDFDQRFDEAQRRLALDHELSHHRSGDIIDNHVAFVLLGLQWFNPLAWLSHTAFR